MMPEQITAILEEMNKTLFKGNLKIEYANCVGDDSAWGPHTWILRYVSDNREWASRVCWLNASKHFEMRHGGGSNFSWWIDGAVLNEVAVRFNGNISDDGAEGELKGVPNKFDSLYEFLERMHQHCRPEVKEILISYDYDLIPPEFKNEQKNF